MVCWKGLSEITSFFLPLHELTKELVVRIWKPVSRLIDMMLHIADIIMYGLNKLFLMYSTHGAI